MTVRTRALLYEEPPIAIAPTLSRLFGLQAAVFLQQLHYWLAQKASSPDRYRHHFVNEQYWVHWTYEQMQQDVPLGKSCDPHKRVIKELVGLGVVLVDQLNAKAWDRTNFYSINYKRLDECIAQYKKRLEVASSINPANREEVLKDIEKVDVNVSMSGISTEHNKTKKTTETSTKKTTTTTSTVVVGVENSFKNIHLSPCAERYRGLIERCTANLGKDLSQEVADEVSGTIKAIEQGRRKAIFEYGSWISALCDKARRGELVVQYGPEVASSRELEVMAKIAALKQRKDEKEAIELLAQNVEVALKVISTIDECDLSDLASSIVVNFPFQSLKQKISDALLSRQLPVGPGRTEAIKMLMSLQAKVGGAHECHV